MTDTLRYHGSLSPEYALLGFLYEQPAHGYDVHQRLVAELGFVWHISQSQVYNILKRLTVQKDISSTPVQQEKLPQKQMLQVTPKGRERFEKWLETPTSHSVRAIRLEFLTRLYFSQKVAPERIPAMLDQQAAVIAAALARLERSQAGLPPGQTFNRLSLRLRVQQLRSALDWLGECRKALV